MAEPDPATAALLADMRTASILSSLWIFVLLSMLFRDVHEFVKQEFLEEALSRTVSEELLLVAGIVLAMAILMVPLSKLLPRRWSRWTNISVAVIIAIAIFTNPPGDLDDYWFMSLEILGLAAIGFLAWKWRPGEAEPGPT